MKGNKKNSSFFYGKEASLGWDPDRWQWKDGGQFLKYTIKDGRKFITSSNPGSTRAGEK